MDFSQALDVKVDDIETPPLLPQGTYIWKITKLPVSETSSSGEWSWVSFNCVAIAAEEDVDTDELDAYGSLSGAFGQVRFMAPTDPEQTTEFNRALDQIKKFCLNTLRVEVDGDANLSELLNGAVGCEFYARAVHEIRKNDPDITDLRVKGWAPLD